MEGGARGERGIDDGSGVGVQPFVSAAAGIDVAGGSGPGIASVGDAGDDVLGVVGFVTHHVHLLLEVGAVDLGLAGGVGGDGLEKLGCVLNALGFAFDPFGIVGHGFAGVFQPCACGLTDGFGRDDAGDMTTYQLDSKGPVTILVSA